jgi:hypothetical protein
VEAAQVRRRACAQPNCTTVLSSFNDGAHCWAHTLDLAELAALGHATTAPRRYVRSHEPVMTDKFLNGIKDTYGLTNGEADEELV